MQLKGQLSLLNIHLYSTNEVVSIRPACKRVRYAIPHYKKNIKINKEILEYKANQKHIFRYKVLHRILELLYQELNMHTLFDAPKYKGIRIYSDIDLPTQAEIQGTERLNIQDRIKLHIRLIRLIRQGVNIELGVRLCQKLIKPLK